MKTEPSRFEACRARVYQGCGGHHEAGPLLAGRPIMVWVCCPSCPNRLELNGMQSERPHDAEVDAIESYNDAVRAIGQQVKDGRQLPLIFVPRGSDGQ